MQRERRQCKPSADRVKRASALEQLQAARAGGARERTKAYEAKREAQEFEQLVKGVGLCLVQCSTFICCSGPPTLHQVRLC